VEVAIYRARTEIVPLVAASARVVAEICHAMVKQVYREYVEVMYHAGEVNDRASIWATLGRTYCSLRALVG
jgi:hypothetical protein